MFDNSLHFTLSDADSTMTPFHYSSGTFGNAKTSTIEEKPQKSKKKAPSNKTTQLSSSSSGLIKPVYDQKDEDDSLFTHVFVCIHRFEKLYKCQMQTLFARIRINPNISIIQTQNAMCVTDTLDLNSSYSLDFRNVPEFSYGDFTPVVELYRRIPKRSELVGLSLLPLKEIETVSIENKMLTYFYHNSRAPLTDIATGGLVGTLVISLGFGFENHQPLFDPYYSIKSSTPPAKLGDHENYGNKNENENEEEEEEGRERSHRHRRHRHSKKKKNRNWQNYAIAFGWQPPTYVDSNWKSKALKKGWVPPEAQILSSIGINVKKEDIVPRENVETQYDPVLHDIVIPVEKDESSTSNADDYDSDLDNLILLLNSKAKKNKRNNANNLNNSSSLSLESPSTIFQRQFPKLSITPVLELLNVESEEIFDELDSSEEMIQSINEILHKTAAIGSNRNYVAPDLDPDMNYRKSNKNAVIAPLPSKLLDMNLNNLLSESDDDSSNSYNNSFDDSSSFGTNSEEAWKNVCRIDPEMKRLLDIAKNS
ncbi:hypothetical protein TRFO_18601 [Tritrichomonas foetus]|uniref:Uncharacterized protein n=1 Tax=Tritrichomonas foetus TaxID=1144522 RepID=A0A1J4KKJ3_9EUKA|nr:hypothetical protein TRFO_18601 [Tritrichomonas foetus]|eukprot:OHT11815.1 hypothetical protein TRFO_18601 [Tritrichomonas foetus]